MIVSEGKVDARNLLSNNITFDSENGMQINGRKIISDVPPVEIDNIVFIPIRFIAEHFDYKVVWDNVNKTVLISKKDKNMIFKIGDPKLKLDGNLKTMIDKPILYNDRTMVPYNFFKNDLSAKRINVSVKGNDNKTQSLVKNGVGNNTNNENVKPKKKKSNSNLSYGIEKEESKGRGNIYIQYIVFVGWSVGIVWWAISLLKIRKKDG
jgi:hypothetical protein